MDPSNSVIKRLWCIQFTISVLLIMVSQRVEIPLLDNPGTSFVKESKTELRGAKATTIEWMILAYVAGKLFTYIVCESLA